MTKSLRYFFIPLFLLPMLFVISCSKNQEDSPQSKTEKKLRIAVIPKGTSNTFWQSVHSGALTAGNELGVKILWSGPKVETDKNQQISIIEDFVVSGVDGMTLAPQDKNAMVAVVERVANAEIPLVIMDSGINTDQYISFVATDNYNGGVEGAREMARRLNNKGKVVIIGNDPGGQSTSLREKGFQETLEKEFPEIKVIDFQYHYNDRNKSRAIMEDLLTRHPDLNGVFCSNESSTLGALLAQQTSLVTKKVTFIGFDSSDEIVEALKKGEIDAFIQQDPFRMGYDGVITVVRYLRGEKVEKRVDTGVFVVTQENMSNPEVEKLLNPDLSAVQ